MEIHLKKTSNGFNFYKDENLIYSGLVTSRHFKYVKQLYNQDKLVVEVLNGFKLPFKFFFKIKFIETNKILTLNLVQFFKSKYVCQFKDDIYEIIPHFGHKTSFFLNGKQIAYFTINEVEFFGGQRIALVANRDVNMDLLLAFILALKCDVNNDYSSVSVDFGNLSSGFQKFDSSWRPY